MAILRRKLTQESNQLLALTQGSADAHEIEQEVHEILALLNVDPGPPKVSNDKNNIEAKESLSEQTKQGHSTRRSTLCLTAGEDKTIEEVLRDQGLLDSHSDSDSSYSDSSYSSLNESVSNDSQRENQGDLNEKEIKNHRLRRNEFEVEEQPAEIELHSNSEIRWRAERAANQNAGDYINLLALPRTKYIRTVSVHDEYGEIRVVAAEDTFAHRLLGAEKGQKLITTLLRHRMAFTWCWGIGFLSSHLVLTGVVPKEMSYFVFFATVTCATLAWLISSIPLTKRLLFDFQWIYVQLMIVSVHVGMAQVFQFDIRVLALIGMGLSAGSAFCVDAQPFSPNFKKFGLVLSGMINSLIYTLLGTFDQLTDVDESEIHIGSFRFQNLYLVYSSLFTIFIFYLKMFIIMHTTHGAMGMITAQVSTKFYRVSDLSKRMAKMRTSVVCRLTNDEENITQRLVNRALSHFVEAAKRAPASSLPFSSPSSSPSSSSSSTSASSSAAMPTSSSRDSDIPPHFTSSSSSSSSSDPNGSNGKSEMNVQEVRKALLAAPTASVIPESQRNRLIDDKLQELSRLFQRRNEEQKKEEDTTKFLTVHADERLSLLQALESKDTLASTLFGDKVHRAVLKVVKTPGVRPGGFILLVVSLVLWYLMITGIIAQEWAYFTLFGTLPFLLLTFLTWNTWILYACIQQFETIYLIAITIAIAVLTTMAWSDDPLAAISLLPSGFAITFAVVIDAAPGANSMGVAASVIGVFTSLIMAVLWHTDSIIFEPDRDDQLEITIGVITLNSLSVRASMVLTVTYFFSKNVYRSIIHPNVCIILRANVITRFITHSQIAKMLQRRKGAILMLPKFRFATVLPWIGSAPHLRESETETLDSPSDVRTPSKQIIHPSLSRESERSDSRNINCNGRNTERNAQDRSDGSRANMAPETRSLMGLKQPSIKTLLSSEKARDQQDIDTTSSKQDNDADADADSKFETPSKRHKVYVTSKADKPLPPLFPLPIPLLPSPLSTNKQAGRPLRPLRPRRYPKHDGQSSLSYSSPHRDRHSNLPSLTRPSSCADMR